MKTVIDAARSHRLSKSPARSTQPTDADHTSDSPSHDLRDEKHEVDEDSFVHFRCHTLAHFIALLCRPIASSVPSDTAVVVIDSLSALLNESFPKATDGQKDYKTKKGMIRFYFACLRSGELPSLSAGGGAKYHSRYRANGHGRIGSV